MCFLHFFFRSGLHHKLIQLRCYNVVPIFDAVAGARRKWAVSSCVWICGFPKALLNSTLTFYLFKLHIVGTELSCSKRIICWLFKAALWSFDLRLSWLSEFILLWSAFQTDDIGAYSCKLLFKYPFLIKLNLFTMYWRAIVWVNKFQQCGDLCDDSCTCDSWSSLCAVCAFLCTRINKKVFQSKINRPLANRSRDAVRLEGREAGWGGGSILSHGYPWPPPKDGQTGVKTLLSAN